MTLAAHPATPNAACQKPVNGYKVRPGKGVVRSMPAKAGTAESTGSGARHDDVKRRKR